MKTINYSIKDLIGSEYNPRKISDKQLNDLKDSIKRFGFVEPVIVNINPERANIIVSGHQRVRAAKELGFSEVPCIEIDLTHEKEKELNVRMNKAGGEWDWKLLQEHFEIPQLIEWGFEEQEIKFDISEPDEKDDEVPEVPEEPKTKPGDIYLLGRHRVMCGDSTKIEDVEKLMDGKKADMVFTDPPYSVNYAEKNKEILKSKNYTEIKNDDLSVDDISKSIWKPVFDNLAIFSKDGASIYVTMPQGGDQMMMMMMMDSWQIKHELIWVKESPVFSMGRLDYDYMHEPIAYGWKKNHQFYGAGQHKKSVWHIKRDGNKSHPTMKPVELICNGIQNSSKQEDLIIDYFLGSGSTLIACEKTNRICYGMEIDPKYCDVIVKRWEEYTGKKAERQQRDYGE